MNRTYNNKMNNSRAYSGNYFTEAQISVTERFFEILSFILNAIFNFVTNEAVVFITKLTISFGSIVGMVFLTGLYFSGVLPFVTAFLFTVCLLGVALVTFKSFY